MEYQEQPNIASIKSSVIDEMNYVLAQNDAIKDSSKHQYRGIYKRWLAVTDRQIKDCSEVSIIEILNKVACAHNHYGS